MSFSAKHNYICALVCFVLAFCAKDACAQQRDTLGRRADTATQMMPVDSLLQVTPLQNDRKIDSVVRTHSPKKAALRSAVLPGWGQIYNKKYWKLPLVYGALGTTAVVFQFNLVQYRRYRYAYQVLANKDTANFGNAHPDLRLYMKPENSNAIRNGRDEYRRSVDYSVLFFIIFWGLNVVDATVDAHLKAFDVSSDLGLKIKAGRSDIAGTAGVSLVLQFK